MTWPLRTLLRSPKGTHGIYVGDGWAWMLTSALKDSTANPNRPPRRLAAAGERWVAVEPPPLPEAELLARLRAEIDAWEVTAPPGSVRAEVQREVRAALVRVAAQVAGEEG